MNLRKQRLLEQVKGDGAPAGGGSAIDATIIENGTAARGIDPAAHQQRGAEAERARMTEIEALSRKYDLSPELRT